MYRHKLSMNVLNKTESRVYSLDGNGRQYADDAQYIKPIAYNRNTTKRMRLKINYPVIAPPTLKCSTAWIVT